MTPAFEVVDVALGFKSTRPFYVRHALKRAVGSVVNLSRWLKVDAESALRGTNLKFRRRFMHIEKRAREMGKRLDEMTLAEMDALWNEAKLEEQ